MVITNASTVIQQNKTRNMRVHVTCGRGTEPFAKEELLNKLKCQVVDEEDGKVFLELLDAESSLELFTLKTVERLFATVTHFATTEIKGQGKVKFLQALKGRILQKSNLQATVEHVCQLQCAQEASTVPHASQPQEGLPATSTICNHELTSDSRECFGNIGLVDREMCCDDTKSDASSSSQHDRDPAVTATVKQVEDSKYDYSLKRDSFRECSVQGSEQNCGSVLTWNGDGDVDSTRGIGLVLTENSSGAADPITGLHLDNCSVLTGTNSGGVHLTKGLDPDSCSVLTESNSGADDPTKGLHLDSCSVLTGTNSGGVHLTKGLDPDSCSVLTESNSGADDPITGLHLDSCSVLTGTNSGGVHLTKGLDPDSCSVLTESNSGADDPTKGLHLDSCSVLTGTNSGGVHLTKGLDPDSCSVLTESNSGADDPITGLHLDSCSVLTGTNSGGVHLTKGLDPDSCSVLTESNSGAVDPTKGLHLDSCSVLTGTNSGGVHLTKGLDPDSCSVLTESNSGAVDPTKGLHLDSFSVLTGTNSGGVYTTKGLDPDSCSVLTESSSGAVGPTEGLDPYSHSILTGQNDNAVDSTNKIGSVLTGNTNGAVQPAVPFINQHQVEYKCDQAEDPLKGIERSNSVEPVCAVLCVKTQGSACTVDRNPRKQVKLSHGLYQTEVPDSTKSTVCEGEPSAKRQKLCTVHKLCCDTDICDEICNSTGVNTGSRKFGKVDCATVDTGRKRLTLERGERTDCQISFRFSVKCSGWCKKWLQPQRLAKELGIRLTIMTGWIVDLNGPMIEICVHINDDSVTVGIPLTRAPLSKRNYILEGGLRSTISWIMTCKADIQPGDTVLDPMCGKGTILVEAGKQNSQVHLIGGDVDERQLLVADKNVKFASLHHCVQLIQLNALNMPLRSSSVDRIVCDAPFGQKFTVADGSISHFYTRWMREMYRLLVPGGRVVVLTSQDLLPTVEHNCDTTSRLQPATLLQGAPHSTPTPTGTASLAVMKDSSLLDQPFPESPAMKRFQKAGHSFQSVPPIEKLSYEGLKKTNERQAEENKSYCSSAGYEDMTTQQAKQGSDCELRDTGKSSINLHESDTSFHATSEPSTTTAPTSVQNSEVTYTIEERMNLPDKSTYFDDTLEQSTTTTTVGSVENRTVAAEKMDEGVTMRFSLLSNHYVKLGETHAYIVVLQKPCLSGK